MFFIFRAWWSWRSVKFFDSPSGRQVFDECRRAFPGKPGEINSDVANCEYNTWLEPHARASDDFLQSIALAIIIPIFYFGSTWLYKYLFPKNE